MGTEKQPCAGKGVHEKDGDRNWSDAATAKKYQGLPTTISFLEPSERENDLADI